MRDRRRPREKYSPRRQREDEQLYSHIPKPGILRTAGHDDDPIVKVAVSGRSPHRKTIHQTIDTVQQDIHTVR